MAFYELSYNDRCAFAERRGTDGKLKFLLDNGLFVKDENCNWALRICQEQPIEVIQEGKEYKGTYLYYEPNANPKIDPPVPIEHWYDLETGKLCYYPPQGHDPNNPQQNLITNINEYTMANTPGYGRPVPKNSTPETPFSLCGGIDGITGTIADLLPELALDPDFVTAVTNDPATGFVKLQIYQEPKGSICKGETITAGGVMVGTRSLDDTEGWCKQKTYQDLDCDSYAVCIDMTTPLVIPPGAGIVGDAIGVLCDADDTDNTVTA